MCTKTSQKGRRRTRAHGQKNKTVGSNWQQQLVNKNKPDVKTCHAMTFTCWSSSYSNTLAFSLVTMSKSSSSSHAQWQHSVEARLELRLERMIRLYSDRFTCAESKAVFRRTRDDGLAHGAGLPAADDSHRPASLAEYSSLNNPRQEQRATQFTRPWRPSPKHASDKKRRGASTSKGSRIPQRPRQSSSAPSRTPVTQPKRWRKRNAKTVTMRAESLATTEADFVKTLLDRQEEAQRHLNELSAVTPAKHHYMVRTIRDKCSLVIVDLSAKTPPRSNSRRPGGDVTVGRENSPLPSFRV